MTSYTPKPGSIAYRAIAWLEQQPVGADFLISKLAEGAGLDVTILGQCLQPAIEAGTIIKRPPKGQVRPNFFSLNPLQHPEYREPAEKNRPPIAAAQALPVVERAAEPPKPVAAATVVEEFGTELGVTYPRIQPAGVIRPMLRCALWSDGSLEIHRLGEQKEPVTFTKEEVRALVGYLDSITVPV